MAKKSEDTKQQKTPKAEPKKAPAKKDIAYDSIIAIFESRFDYQAARTMANNAIESAGLERKKAFPADEVKKLIDVVPLLDIRTTSIIEGLNALLD